MTAAKILVVEDDTALAGQICQALRQHGFEVELATRGDQATELATRFKPQLIVLDLMLPGKTGEELLEEWHGRQNIPVIVLTARVDLNDRLRCFNLGAADFLPKPFWTEELIARINTRLRIQKVEPTQTISWADIRIDLDARRTLRGEQELHLTAHEFNVLAYLAQRPGRALSRDQIATSALSTDEEIDARTVDSHIARVRKKLGKEAAAVIKTVWRIGYRFDL